jgi:hypothetical protein
MKRERAHRLLIAALLFGAAGCIFEPREAQPPTGGDDTCWIIPNTPTDVFSNLACGLKSAGNSSYERSIGQDFVYIPLPGYDGPGNFEGWNVDVELEFIEKLKSDYQGERTVKFGDESGRWDQQDIETSRASFLGEYRITLYRGDGSDPEVYAGKAEFLVLRGSTGWVLEKWEDYDVVGTFPTSANLRGSYRQ